MKPSSPKRSRAAFQPSCSPWPREVRAKKTSLTLILGTNGLKVTSEPPPMAGQAGCFQGQDRSAVTYPSSSHARRCLIWLFCDNRRTRYTAPLATLDDSSRIRAILYYPCP
ncbi:hypothetical protein J6590_098523 [Homalodisca vitripennis]|nr:hypothetical protein J6590_098523 [Homalodisca vitripennis]